MSEKPQRQSRKRNIFAWIIRAIYVSLLMGFIDCYSDCYLGHGAVSVPVWEDRGKPASYGYVGFGYCLSCFHRDTLDGPVIWFWFTPFVIDAAHRGIQVHWIWSQDDA
jgi:hypothetical protein